ncbi:developmentally-regulated GTP-binding protein (macronuclear) [Tetrahymena thermophila SB210]|uniref:Developmentally-regulated GTP-binding protein n=1 Tax=Tetrahymena thermophila (strain SB210) TaxID=312017 RepID=I7M2Q1_TETTS|nr:developmentally-regulated GTP-binding protein [Tetrahymena thermophila SB210]EAS01083.1 developmentally-regulated GTP-binding protein [Tetrahymena thermophila SB210]|eukprot:XP_001021328.1 developmentally-regulated GTP-binding protein [Tetrahymena thermophila SB210]
MGVLEKIKEIEEEMARTQKNKATEYHLGLLKAKLAKYRTQLLEPASKGPKGEGFEVQKFGNARVCMIGFPSVGKSTLLSSITETESLAAAYEFTTLTCIPGVINYNDTKIQLLDLPGIIEGAADGRGRGRQVIAVAKASDLVLMVLDAQKSEEHKAKLTYELEKVGIRLNQERPDITVTINKTGGVKLISTCQLTRIDEKQVKNIFSEYKIHNATILCRQDVTIDDIIDSIEGNRKYVRCLYVYNKIDTISIEEVDMIARQPNNVVISCHQKLNFDYLLEKIWENLGLVRIYTKRKGQPPDLGDPLILTHGRNGCTIKSAVEQIHRDLIKDFAHATVWGRSAKFMPQKVGLNHILCDEDVIQIYKKAKTSTKAKESNKLVSVTEKKDVKKEAKDMKDQKAKDKKK